MYSCLCLMCWPSGNILKLAKVILFKNWIYRMFLLIGCNGSISRTHPTPQFLRQRPQANTGECTVADNPLTIQNCPIKGITRWGPYNGYEEITLDAPWPSCPQTVVLEGVSSWFRILRGNGSPGSDGTYRRKTRTELTFRGLPDL